LAHLAFAALLIFARTSADIVRFFDALFPLTAARAASIPANRFASVPRSSWSSFNKSVISQVSWRFCEIVSQNG
jgi:hypothetical protein